MGLDRALGCDSPAHCTAPPPARAHCTTQLARAEAPKDGGFGHGHDAAHGAPPPHQAGFAGRGRPVNGRGAGAGGGFQPASAPPRALGDRVYTRRDLLAVRSDMLSAGGGGAPPPPAVEDAPEIWRPGGGGGGGGGGAFGAPPGVGAAAAAPPPGLKSPFEKRLDKLAAAAVRLALRRPWAAMAADQFTYVDDNRNIQV